MIRLYLLGEKALYVLRGFNHKHIEWISEVIVGRDSSVINDYAREIEIECKTKGIQCFTRGKEPLLKSKYSIAIGWRWLMDTKNENLIIFHDSLLPKLRGFNPLVTALIHGHSQIGVTAIIASEEYDKGPIISQKARYIHYPIKIAKAIALMGSLFVELFFEMFDKLVSGNLETVQQIEQDASYSLWRDELNYFIDWKRSAEDIKRFIDAVGYPYKGAKTNMDNQVVRILDSEVYPDVLIDNREPGKVIFKKGDEMVIVCGNGLLLVKELYNDSLSERIRTNKFRIRFF